MNTKYFYRKGLWEAIERHPQYELGERELAALEQFLNDEVSNRVSEPFDLLHLAIGSGREIPLFAEALPSIQSYLLNDICNDALEEAFKNRMCGFSVIPFSAHCGDVEQEGSIASMRDTLSNRTLIALVGNAVIFSNRSMDKLIRDAMKEEDLFLLTVESPHNGMLGSYLIPPVFALLSGNGIQANSENINAFYDAGTQTVRMVCNGETLLASYKPTFEQLQARMAGSGFKEVATAEYPDLHMLAGLYRKR